MGLRVDFTDVEDSGALVSPGKYDGVVTGGEIREAGENSKNPGSEYINWEFTIEGGDFGGRKVWDQHQLGREGFAHAQEFLERHWQVQHRWATGLRYRRRDWC